MKSKSCLNLILPLLIAVISAAISPPRLAAAPGPAHALGIDGTNDYVSASIPAELTSNYTIAAWVFLAQYQLAGTENDCAFASGSIGSLLAAGT